MDDLNQLPFKDNFPQLTVSAFFWLSIIIAALIAAICGYGVGYRVAFLPSSQYFTQNSQAPQIAQAPPMMAPLSGTPIPGDDGDIDYAVVNGTFTTNTTYYDQFFVYIDQWKNGVRTGQSFDDRLITKPQPGVTYPFSFMLLNPAFSYVLTTSVCHTNAKGYALVCAKHIKIDDCTGTIIDQGTACIIPANTSIYANQSGGDVDYSLNIKDNPIPAAK